MLGIERLGAPGTTAAVMLLNDAVKKGGVMATSYAGGLSGAFIPVSEDANFASAARFSARCSDGPPVRADPVGVR